jgi:hypothetical protein
MAFLIILLRIFCRIVRVRDRSNKNITVLQNCFAVNLHDWMTDNQIDMADCSNRAAERDSVSDAKMKRAELTFIFQFDPTENLNASVLAMKFAKNTARTYDTDPLNRARNRRVLIRRSMCFTLAE